MRTSSRLPGAEVAPAAGERLQQVDLAGARPALDPQAADGAVVAEAAQLELAARQQPRGLQLDERERRPLERPVVGDAAGDPQAGGVLAVAVLVLAVAADVTRARVHLRVGVVAVAALVEPVAV